jgi:hypothetical protein
MEYCVNDKYDVLEVEFKTVFFMEVAIMDVYSTQFIKQ